MLTKDFYYDLPKECIAQTPIKPRDHSKLMILNCAKKEIKHGKFYEITDYLHAGDLLVVNNSKVFHARLTGYKKDKPLEIFLLRPDNENWIVLIKPGKKILKGDVINFEDNINAKVETKLDDGTVIINFNISHEDVFNFAEKYGKIPTPPYVKTAPSDTNDYQTVYAKITGSVAAPTAGFHFTPELLLKLRDMGIKIAYVTLHVGLGTFRPVKTEKIEDHKIHEEWIEINRDTAKIVNETKRNGGKIIAVGTTSVRALESVARKNINHQNTDGKILEEFSGFTNLFIKPGDDFKVVDVMITNFHLPESTLIMLVSAFAQSKINQEDEGRKFVLNAYQKAINNDYRFYSFGDAMILF